jgi:hypothetical protein
MAGSKNYSHQWRNQAPTHGTFLLQPTKAASPSHQHSNRRVIIIIVSNNPRPLNPPTLPSPNSTSPTEPAPHNGTIRSAGTARITARSAAKPHLSNFSPSHASEAAQPQPDQENRPCRHADPGARLSSKRCKPRLGVPALVLLIRRAPGRFFGRRFAPPCRAALFCGLAWVDYHGCTCAVSYLYAGVGVLRASFEKSKRGDSHRAGMPNCQFDSVRDALELNG